MNLPKFSPSSIATYNDCPQRWEYSYIDGLKSKVQHTKAMDIGTYAHELMHHAYRAVDTGIKPGSEMMMAWMDRKLKQDVAGVTTENAHILSVVYKMITEYVFRQMGQIDTNIRSIVGVEMTCSIQVTTPNGHEVILEGIADLVYTSASGRLRIRDHKTGGRDNFSEQGLMLHPQLLFYLTVLSKLGYSMEGVEISWINSTDYKDRSKVPFEKLFKFYRYNPQPEVLNNFWDYLMNRIDTIMEVSPQPSYGQQCGTCSFNGICRLKLNGQPTINFISGQFDRAERTYSIPVLWKETCNAEQHSNGVSANQESFNFNF